MSIQQKHIEKASSQDLVELEHLLARANEYSLKLSNRQAWENTKKAYNVITKELQKGNVFIIRNNDAITSSITLSETSDVWGELGKDNKALYFMKLMKDPDKAHSDEGIALLKFAAQEAEKRKNIYVRCDAVTDNVGIISYYKKLGFQEKGYVSYNQNRQGVLLQIPISQLLLISKIIKKGSNPPSPPSLCFGRAGKVA